MVSSTKSTPKVDGEYCVNTNEHTTIGSDDGGNTTNEGSNGNDDESHVNLNDGNNDLTVMVSVPGDGNCGYHAMMDALWKDTITSSVTEFHHELRQ